MAVAHVLDLHTTTRAITTGQLQEGNAALVEAEELAERLGLDRQTGRNAASTALTVGFVLLCRQVVYPRSPRLAKIALAAFASLRFGAAAHNERLIRVTAAPTPRQGRAVAVRIRF